MLGSRYWTRLWCEISLSSSIRMPVMRRTSIAAQPQKALLSSRQVPALAGGGFFSPKVRRVPLEDRAPQRLSVGGEQLAGAGASAGLQADGGGLAVPVVRFA
ncbi:hypothetical protein GCM10010254_74500 [Streptomyces chromofuscus]|nr:hypothetical protein GCM10010254_74500 [Streptomyces chromofuscus]